MAITMDLDEAAVEIRRACEGTEQSPFFFLVGAGISYPSIPLSEKITQDCAAKYEADQVRFPSLKPRKTTAQKSRLDSYSHFFELAYPQPQERAEYLAELIRHKPISGATLRLGHLLASAKVSQLVITPNFDDHLERALSLFGEPVIVCDHPLTTARINAARRGVIQIVHVHGTFWYYDCCNLKYEIVAQAQQPGHELSSMPMLLTQVLSYRSPLVVGYSGWEDDLIMGTLKRRLLERTAYNVYWFCYSDNDFARLPTWLRDHQNVRFIRSADSELAADQIPRVLGDDSNAVSKAFLPAQRVFDALIQAFDVPEPPLTADPLGFLSRRLRLEAGIAAGSADAMQVSTEGDLYNFGSVVERIERAARLEKLDLTGPEPLIETVRSLLRRSDYNGIVSLSASGKIRLTELNDTQLDTYAYALELAARNLAPSDFDDTKAAWTMALRASKQLLKQQPSDAARLRVAKNRLDFADVLYVLFDQSIYAETLLRYIIDDNTLQSVAGGQEVRIRALIQLGSMKDFENDPGAAQALYELATATEFIQATDNSVRTHVAVALRLRARCALQLGDVAKSAAAFDTLAELFLDSSDPIIRLQVVYAMRDRVTFANRRGHYDDVIAVAEMCESAARDVQDEHLLGVTVSVQVQHALALFRKGEFDVALCYAKEVITRRRKGRIRFASDGDCLTAYYVATAALLELRHKFEAKQMLIEAEAIFGKQNMPRFEELFTDIRRILESG